VIALITSPVSISADTLKVTITNVSTATSVSFMDTTSNLQFLTGAESPISTVPGNPFPAGFNYSYTGFSNVPGLANIALLSTQTIEFSNASGSAQHLRIEFEAFDFALPENGSNRSVTTAFTTNSSGGSSGSMAAYFDGAFLDSQSVGGSKTTAHLVASTGFYSMKSVFDVMVPAGAINTNLAISMSVTPEPWNYVSVVATILPVGLLYRALRRRKENELSAANS